MAIVIDMKVLARYQIATNTKQTFCWYLNVVTPTVSCIHYSSYCISDICMKNTNKYVYLFIEIIAANKPVRPVAVEVVLAVATNTLCTL